ncbi:E3 ubiquitin-protein ligase RBBP6-like [Mya arenaria]|uniref:E3 ubiquitin-protein ligase RBBP6-like n=1 Tax=Mya arenaria TaxID=6604 RepID=UPI0022E02252|nr:E3 ubiquitin-protein ligase RBBP6-like [Mya arenaria]
MAVVHYKFKNSVEYDSVTFDGLAISLRDLKQSIMRKKNMRPEDIDLQVINAQNGEEYSSPSIMIPKNSSLTISRIPVGGGSRRAQEITPTSKKMKWAAFRKETQQAIQEAESGSYNTDKLKQSSDPANASSSEIEKIAQMMKQSTKDFDPANYNYKVPKGTPSTSYTCFKCGKGGHYIQNCPNTDAEGASNSPSEFAQRIKRPTGIPMEHMLVVNEPLPGTYQTHTGQYTVPKIDAEAYATGKKERPPFLPEPAGKRMVVKQKPVPKELKCPLCGDMARDAVVIPCCGISYCDECIRNKLLESDDHICPSCDSMNVSPDGLIANQMLRRAVTNFQNETGYTKIAQKTAAIQAKVEEAAKAAAAAAPVLQKQSVVPRGPSVMDYKPPPRQPSPPKPKVSVTPSKPPMESGLPSEPPTPTMDEPVRSVSGYQPPSQPPAQHPPTQHQGVAVPTLVGGTLQNRNLQPAVPTSTYGYFPPSVNTSIAPPNMPHYPIPTAFPPPPVIRPFAPPVVLAPPGVPGYPPPTHTAIPPPPINMPKPLSEQEFFEEKQRLIREGTKVVDDPLLKVFANKLEKRGNRSRTRSRTKSRSPPRFRSRTRSRSWERKRSYTPRRSLTPRRSYSPYSRRYSPRRSRSRSRGYSPRRYLSPRRSRTRSRSRYRSLSRSPVRRRTFSRSRSRSRRRSPYRRSPARRSPLRRSPLRRSYSRERYSPRPLSPRPRSPLRRSPYRRSRSRDRSPVGRGYQRARSPLPARLSPVRRRPSPIRRPQDKLLKTVRSKSPPAAKKRRPGVAKDSKRRNESKAKVTEEKSNKTSLLRKDPDLIDISENEGSPEKSVRRNETVKTNKENIPARLLPVGKKGNNITVVLVDSTTNEESKRAESEAEKQDTAAEMDGTKESRTNSEKVKAVEDKKEEVKADIEKAPASEVTTEPKKKKITLKLKSDKVRKSGNEKSSKNESEGDTKTSEKESDAVLSDNKENKKSEKDVKEKQERRPRSSKSRKDQKKRSSSKSDSESPPRFKEPLRMEGDKRFGPRPVADRVERAPPEWERTGDAWAPRILDQRDYRGRGRGVDFRGRGMGPNYRGAQQGPNFRGPPQGTDFRGVPFGDYRGDYRGPPAGHPDFRGYPGYQGPPAPGFPGPFQPGGYPPPPPVPVMDPREDPNYHGNLDEDVLKFEQYKQMYDMYNRTYGFAPPSSSQPSNQTPPQGPPPAPPGTIPMSTPPDRARPGSPGRRSPSRRHRSPERSKDRRERDSDRRSDRRRSERDSISPDRKLDRSTDRTRDSSTSPDRLRSSQTEDDQRDTSPEQKRTDKERRKDKKAKKRKEKGEVGEKKKRKKKDKVKTKKEKADKKGKKVKKVKSSDEEPIQPVVKKSKKQESDDSEISDLETVEPRKRHDSSAQSESSDHEDIEKVQLSPVRQESREDVVETDGKTVEQETIVSSSVSAKEEREAISEQAEKPEPASDSEVSQSDAVVEPSKKRRSIKRLKEEDTEDAKASKKVKLEIDVDKAETQVKSEKMDVSGDQSDESSDLDEIPVPESELMLDPPELSKWEKDDDPYELSPEPTRVKQKWKPEKQTLLPRAVIAKAENVISSKVMKPTLVSSAVVAAVKKDTKTEILEKEVLKKREKSPVPKMDETLEPKRRVYMDSEPKRSDERRVSSSKSHNMQVTVSSTGSEKRKVATDKSGGDLREKLREKREKEDRGGRDDRGRDDKVRDTRVRDDRNRVRDDRDRVRDDRDRGDRVRDSRVKDDRDRIRDDRDRGDRVRDDRRNRDESKSTDKKRRDSHHKDRDSRDYDRQDSRGSNKKVSRYDSVVDDSKFEPDYEDESVSEDNSEDSSTDSSSEEETKRKKHKHKKTKHKKDKKQKKKKEKKKKKHKVEKR